MGSREGSASRHSPSLSSPQRPVQLTAASKPVPSQSPNMASSANQQERHRTSQPANLMASGQQDMPSASNWPPYMSQNDDPWAESWPVAQPLSASGWSHGVVPLKANFKPCGMPRRTTMSVVPTHVDNQCSIFVHELHGGAYCIVLSC